MPEHMHPLEFASEKPGAEHHVRPALTNGFVEIGEFGRVVFQIGILDDDHVARCRGQPGGQSGSFALIPCVEEQPATIFPLEFTQ